MAAPKGHSKAWETRRQNEEFARQNIDPAEQILFDKVKGKLKGSTPHAKAEAFKEYLEAHPKELAAAQQAHADSRMDALVAQRNASSPSAASTSMSDYGDSRSYGVPF